MIKPEQIKDEQINLKDLRQMCQYYIDFVDNDKEYSEDNDYSDYIFEAAMTTIFGKEVFHDFINKRQP